MELLERFYQRLFRPVAVRMIGLLTIFLIASQFYFDYGNYLRFNQINSFEAPPSLLIWFARSGNFPALVFGLVLSFIFVLVPLSVSNFLRVGKYESESGEFSEFHHLDIAVLRDRLEEVEANLSKEANLNRESIAELRTNATSFSDIDKSKILADATDALTKEAVASLMSIAGEGYAREVSENIRDRSLYRFSEQVSALGLRANLTLIIGIFFAILGLTLLWYTFFVQGNTVVISGQTISPIQTPPASSEDPWLRFVELYLPRFSLVIIVELVAFHFLRLYSKALSEIRFVHNETTNVEMKLIALYYSIRHDLTGSTQKVIENLISTERNSVLEKSQTTAEIEKERASSEGDTNTIKAITDLLHGTDKGWFWQSRK